MTDTLPLLPCPFCGGHVEFGYFATTPNIHCAVCKYEVDAVNGETEAAFKKRWNTRADLARPKVKPLVWGRSERSGMNLQADCSFGRYYIALRSDEAWLWWRPANGPAHEGRCSSEDECKAAAQADYERRILEAME